MKGLEKIGKSENFEGLGRGRLIRGRLPWSRPSALRSRETNEHVTITWTHTRLTHPPSNVSLVSLSPPDSASFHVDNRIYPKPILSFRRCAPTREESLPHLKKEGRGRDIDICPKFQWILSTCSRVPPTGDASPSRTASFPNPRRHPPPHPPHWDPLSFPSSPVSSALHGGHRQDVSFPPGLLPRPLPRGRLSCPSPYTQPDKVPSVTCPLTSPLLPCLTSSAGQGLGGEQGISERDGRARMTLTRALRGQGGVAG